MSTDLPTFEDMRRRAYRLLGDAEARQLIAQAKAALDRAAR